MSKKLLIISVVVIIIIAGGVYYYLGGINKPITGYPPVPGKSFIGYKTTPIGLDSKEQKYWGQAVILSGVNNYSGKDDKIEISVDTYSARPPMGSEYNVGIYKGSCDTSGKIKYILPNLVIDGKGTKSMAIFDISFDNILQDLPLSIRVSDKTGVVACGDILSDNVVVRSSSVADWKTYSNNDYGFEIKYPSILSASELQESIAFTNLSAINSRGSGIAFSVIKGDISLAKGRTDWNFEDKGEITIGAYKAKKFIRPFSPVNAATESIAYVFSEKNISILYHLYTADSHKITESVMNQILSTFKFTK